MRRITWPLVIIAVLALVLLIADTAEAIPPLPDGYEDVWADPPRSMTIEEQATGGAALECVNYTFSDSSGDILADGVVLGPAPVEGATHGQAVATYPLPGVGPWVITAGNGDVSVACKLLPSAPPATTTTEAPPSTTTTTTPTETTTTEPTTTTAPPDTSSTVPPTTAPPATTTSQPPTPSTPTTTSAPPTTPTTTTPPTELPRTGPSDALAALAVLGVLLLALGVGILWPMPEED